MTAFSVTCRRWQLCPEGYRDCHWGELGETSFPLCPIALCPLSDRMKYASMPYEPGFLWRLIVLNLPSFITWLMNTFQTRLLQSCPEVFRSRGMYGFVSNVSHCPSSGDSNCGIFSDVTRDGLKGKGTFAIQMSVTSSLFTIRIEVFLISYKSFPRYIAS